MANFEAEKLALKYCKEYGIERGTKEYDMAINAFTVGYKYHQAGCEADVRLNNLLSAKLAIAMEALEKIRNGSEDHLPPFRAMGAGQMKGVAYKAINEIDTIST